MYLKGVKLVKYEQQVKLSSYIITLLKFKSHQCGDNEKPEMLVF